MLTALLLVGLAAAGPIEVPTAPVPVDTSPVDPVTLRLAAVEGRVTAWRVQVNLRVDREAEVRGQSRAIVTTEAVDPDGSAHLLVDTRPVTAEALALGWGRTVPAAQAAPPVPMIRVHQDPLGRTLDVAVVGEGLHASPAARIQHQVLGVARQLSPGWPEEPVSPGSTWTVDEEVVLPLDHEDVTGTLRLETTTDFTLEGWAELEGERLVVLVAEAEILGVGDFDDGGSRMGMVGRSAGRLLVDPATGEPVWGASRARVTLTVGTYSTQPTVMSATMGFVQEPSS